MTCNEFVRVLPELEGGHTIEQQQHLRTCPRCAELVSDLNAITQQAQLLRTIDEDPSPRVWNSIEIALRQEGLIRQPQPHRVPVPVGTPRPRLTWLVPAMAVFLLVFGLLVYERGGVQHQVASAPAPVVTADLAAGQGLDLVPEEKQLLSLVESRNPSLRAGFESDLRAVNTYIRDAEQSARSNPNDEIAQQYLMNAYEQRAMVYEMALDRSLQ